MGCVNFMDAWKNAFFLQEKPMSIKFLVLGGGGVFVFFLGGGSADFISMGAQIFLKKNNKQKTHKHFSDGPWGTIVPGMNPHPSQGQTGQNGDFTVELNRERPVCPREGSHLSQGRFLFVPDTVPPKMFMFIGFFLPDWWPGAGGPGDCPGLAGVLSPDGPRDPRYLEWPTRKPRHADVF